MLSKVRSAAEIDELQVPWKNASMAMPAYGCAFVVAYSALLASASTIDAPLFGSTAFVLGALGLLSNYIRSVGSSKGQHYFGQAMSLTLVVLLPLYGLIIDPHRFFPPIVFEFRDYHPLALMTWVCVITLTVTGRWGNNEYAPLSFVLLPALSMIALSAPHNINIEVTVATLFIVIFGTFLLAYETTVMRASKLGDEDVLNERSLIGFHIYSGAQWSLVILLVSSLLAPLLLLIRLPIAPPNVRLPLPRRYFIVSPEFTIFSRHMSLWGGPINLSPRKVFEIRGDFYPYWRAQIYDEYTGHGWQYNEDEDPIPAEQIDYGVYKFNVSMPPHPKIVSATVTALGMRPSVFLTPGTTLILEVEGLLPELRLSHGGVLRAYKVGFSPQVYKIVAAINDPPLDAMRSERTAYNDLSRDELSKYLRLPYIPQRVIDLARQVVSSAKTPYEKAMLLAEYLRKNYRYSLSPPHVPMDADAVDFFLFWSREGACNFFASAHAVMCRAVGIPSRVITGFMSDEYDSKQRLLIIRERDAHAWVEVYIPKHGWVIVDPTPPSRSRIPVWDIAAWWRELRSHIKWRFAQRLFLWVVGLLAVISAVPMLRHQLRIFKKRFAGIRLTPGHRLSNSYAALVRELCRLGFRCEPHHTPLQIASVLRAYQCSEPIKSTLINASRLLQHLSVLAYSPIGFNEANVSEFEAEAKRLIWRMRWHWLLTSLRRFQKLLSVRRSRAL
ncbi:MAG: transglutaminase-like domain-containing protein [Armatimonadota bacterium]|nr:transglutaminase-like domain-containing protein [Armatimonadota bacterium]MCX7778152.1 transglutaminase-like domain-containing protein [Armatimonadota bacterium]MDW8024506.1 transglutaminase-like domain-containing protein [Armatimonadota bacterium]